MDFSPQSFKLLTGYSKDERNGPIKSYRLISNINNELNTEQFSASTIDLYLQYIFDKSCGLPVFVLSTMNKQIFKDAIVQALEILFTLLNNFHLKVEKEIVEINRMCLTLLKSFQVISNIKVKALDVLILGFEKIDKSHESTHHYKEVYDNLFNSTKIKKSDSVQGKLLIALGMFSNKFPHIVDKNQELKFLFIRQLEKEITQKQKSNNIISGIFQGLVSYCNSFPIDSSKGEETKNLSIIYKFIKELLVPKEKIKIANRAALIFLANNISLFSKQILQDYKVWHKELLKWLNMAPEERKVGVTTIEAFYKCIGEALAISEDTSKRDVLMHFLTHFSQTMSNSVATNYEKRSSIKGFCFFSATCYEQLEGEEVTKVFMEIMHSFEQTYIINQDQINENYEYLPDYIQAIASFMFHNKSTTANEIFCLQRAVVNMIKIFPHLQYSQHLFVIDTLVLCLFIMRSNEYKIFDNFTENIVYQGILWTCSHEYTLNAALVEDSEQGKCITVKNYLPLWKGLLSIIAMSKYNEICVNLEERRIIMLKIVDKLIKTLLVLINKLNVSLLLKENDLPSTDVQFAYKVNQVNDFAIFLNVVDFYEEILVTIDPTIFNKCITKLINHLIMKCRKYPLISGFYKLLACCLKISNKINFFDEISIETNPDTRNCYDTLSKFIQILLSKVNQYKDELLVACLQVLLEYPIAIIKEMLLQFVPTYTAVFYLSRSYIKLADMGLTNLERWQKKIEPDIMESFLIEIVSSLDTFLRSKSLGAQSSIIEQRKKSASILKKRRILMEIEPELVELQRRILNFLGQQSSVVCQAFVSSKNYIEPGVVQCSKSHLKITLPYEDIKLDLYLDQLTPQVINLALYCSDRKTRIAACELLQAIVIVFLGTTKQMSRQGLLDLNELLKKVTYPLLQLSCDLDPVVQQLFKPLFLQIIHWYTHASQRGQDHTAIVIDALMEGITHPSDSALRDFSGLCVNEFIKWTIKQTSENRLAENPLNIKVLLRKIRFFSSHSDSSKKLGAALIFNNIYKEIREETAILSSFWIEFLYLFITSLSLIENNYLGDENTIIQINYALNHIQRGFKEKHVLFNNEDQFRRIPSGVIKGQLLNDVVFWLLQQTGSNSCYCREKCMELYCNLAPFAIGYQKNLKQFFSKYIQNENEWIAETYESFLIKYPTLDDLVEVEVENTLILFKWLYNLSCCLDGYNFIIKHNLINLEIIPNKTVLIAVEYFLKNLQLAKLENALALIKLQTWSFTSFEKEEFQKQKSVIVLQILNFINLLLNNNKSVNALLSRDYWNLMLNLIFNPQLLGFDIYDIKLKYCDISITVLNNISRKIIDNNKILEFTNLIYSYIKENNDFINIDLTTSNVTLKQRTVVKGLLFLHLANIKQLNLLQFTNGIVEKFLENFQKNQENRVIYMNDLHDTMVEHCSLLLQFAFLNPNEFEVFVNHLFDDYTVNSLDTYKITDFGFYLLTLFEDTLIKEIIIKFDSFINISLNKNMKQTVNFILFILNYITNNRSSFKQYYQSITQILLQSWDKFESYFVLDISGQEQGIKFVKFLLPIMKLYKIRSICLNKWLNRCIVTKISSLNKENEFNFKIDVFSLLVEVTDSEDYDLEELNSTLSYLQINFFSNESNNKNSSSNVVNFNKLLIASRNITVSVFVKFLLEIYMTLILNGNEENFSQFLSKFMSSSNENLQGNALKILYELCLAENFTFHQKYQLIANVNPLFDGCNKVVLERFFVENITTIISSLQQQQEVDNSELNLIKKITQFVLIEVMFLKFRIDPSASSSVCSIAEAASMSENKKLLFTLLTFTLNTCKEEIEINNKELVRLYKCHSYKAMVSIISNSLKDINFYTKLFIRQVNNEDVLWCDLINTNQIYHFEKVFDNIPKRRKILVNIRNENRINKKQKSIVDTTKSVNYIESQRLFNSSLSEDITKYDFSNTVLRTQTIQQEIQEEICNIQSVIELDSTDINNHELMPTVCGLIKFMAENGVIQLTEDEQEICLPAWAKGIRNLLLFNETHKNIKIFWVKVIDNTATIFKYYAKWFLKPLLKFVADKCAGETLNYFIADVIAVLVSWSDKVIPTEDNEKTLASEVLRFLVENIEDERQDIFKYHLDLIKLIIEAWKSTITIPYDLMLLKITFDANNKKINTGIHLSAIFLANNISPCYTKNLDSFFKTILNNISKISQKSIFRPYAETVGLFLRFFTTTAVDNNFEKYLEFTNIFLKRINEPEKYAYCLEAIALHYSLILDEFHLCKILNRINSSSVSVKSVYLKLVLKRIEILSDVSDFKNEPWDKYLDDESNEIQILALEVVNKTLNILEQSQRFQLIIQSVCRNITNPDVLCRSLMYDIAIAVCRKNDNNNTEVMNLCTNVAIQGLADKDLDNQTKIYKFWSDNSNLPLQLSKRFSHILANLYTPDTEQYFLGYSTHLLLKIIEKTNEYKENIFEHPLEDCNFQEHLLQTNWRYQQHSIVPMFAETLRTNSVNPESFSISSLEQLRETQTVRSFEPTRSERSKQFSQFTTTDSSLYLGGKEDISNNTTGSGDLFVNPNIVELSNKYKLYPKRRFLKSKMKIMRQFANREIKKSVTKFKKRYDQAKERENKVSLYRKYRKGDFPDIQIALASILDPLQALVLFDAEISKIVYKSIVDDIVKKIDESTEFLGNITVGIKNIFNNSTQFNSSLFKTLLDLILNNKNCMLFEPGLISYVCQCSGLTTIGTLVLEEFLISAQNDYRIDLKRTRGPNNEESLNEINYWVKLAELYKEMDEWDLVKCIFLEKMNCNEIVEKAVLAESQKNWKDAKSYYKYLLKNDESLNRKDFYYESYFKCFAYLGDWENIPVTIDRLVTLNSEEITGSWEALWDHDFNQQKLLPWYITSEVKNILFNESKNCNDFLNNINTCLKDIEKSEYLKTNYSDELCMLWIYHKDVDIAKNYLRSCIDEFLDNWQLLDPMCTNLRYNKILKLRNIVDISKFIDLFDNFDIDYENELGNLQNYWNKTTNEVLPSILLNETRVLYRKHFIKLLIDKINSFHNSDFDNIVEELKETEYLFYIDLINIANNQSNYYMAKKYYMKCEDKTLKPEHDFKLQLSLINLGCLKADILQNPSEKLNVMLELMKTLEPLFDNSQNPYSSFQIHLKEFEIFEEIVNIIVQDKDIFHQQIQQLSTIIKTVAPLNSTEDIVLYSTRKLKEFLYKYETNLNEMMMITEDYKNNLKEQEILANTYLHLANFLRKQQNTISSHVNECIRFVLKAMKLNCVEARQIFPCILMEENLHCQYQNTFIEETKNIPTWMFLNWIPQLLANIDSVNILVVAPIILRIAKTYPQSIMYSYRLSKENYKFKEKSIENQAKPIIEQLDNLLLNDKNVDVFLKALASVSLPTSILRYYVTKLHTACHFEHETNFKIVKQNVMNEVFRGDSNNIQQFQGEMFKQIEKFRDFFQNIEYTNLEKLLNDLKDVDRELQTIQRSSKTKNSSLLKDYCPWLADFSANKLNIDLEIPGQYDGSKLPLTQHHIKISGFCPNVAVLKSLRKPIQLTILGNDTKEYPFLIKFGEDIRQDQRIEQLFTLMNNIIQRDCNCNRQRLEILTYQVIPLTTNLGIIQWIDNTVSLHQFIINSIKDQEILNKFFNSHNQFHNWICDSKKLPDVHSYGLSVRNYSRNKVIPFYRSLVNIIPWDIMKQGFWDLSLNTECYIALRNNFIRSYSILCASHWILGIGDRHLSNSLICIKNGNILGIDFGYAFGTGTQLQAIPELVPFRLTPHIVGLMEPFGEKGLFKEIMISFLKTLRNNSSSLLATMNVFIQEPSLDWLEHVSRCDNSSSNSDSNDDNQEWYPIQKIDQAKRKLEGVNSVVVMIEDLESGPSARKHYVEAYSNLVKGCPEYDVRARKNSNNLSVEDQVDCLIDHATDYNLLGRMFQGWSAWV